jgi:KaiC/GvpD/RAD55 family RecA-like ATPase/DNA-binding response OmpR family regulator
MTASTDVPSSTPNTSDVQVVPSDNPAVPLTAKTDTPMPIPSSIHELANAPDTEGAVAAGEIAVSPEIIEGAPQIIVESSDRMISGIDLIDYGAGGLLPDHVYLVKGGSGLGKTVIGLQFLTRGLEHGEPGILITDQKPEKVLTQARAIGFQIDEAVKRGQLAILNPSNHYFELVESPADVEAIVQELGDYAARVSAKRIVIDPVNTLVNTQYSSHFAMTLTQSLLNALEDLDQTILLIADDSGGDAELAPIVHLLEQNAFGVIALEHDQATGGRLMKLTKLRYASAENLSAHYRILNGRGLINYRGGDEKVTDVTRPWEDTATASRSVLLIGAQPETIRRVRESLGDRYEVNAESDVRAGVERVKRDKPGLVLVTPQRSAAGVAAVMELSQSSTSSIAYLSPSTNRRADKVLYLRAGADDFITEPFTPSELQARVDALIRRSGRRLNIRDSNVEGITPEDIANLTDNGGDDTGGRRNRAVLTVEKNNQVTFEPRFRERIQRSIDTVTKFDTPFAVYWIKGEKNDRDLNKSLAKLCRQEDILCHNRNGEFVAILTGTDANGVKGFESRLNEKLGDHLSRAKRGFQLYRSGEV